MLRTTVLLFSILAVHAAPAAPAADVFAGYLDHAALTARVQALAGRSVHCRVDTLATSRDGRAVHLVMLAADPDAAGDRPALLIVAGLDGRHLVGTETAVRVAEQLVDQHAELLDDVTVYIVPRLSPDAAERNLGDVNAGLAAVGPPVDDDRDGLTDEDGPVDLNGDGVITQMRRRIDGGDQPLDETPTHRADDGEPRLMVKPDRDAGERATHALYTEGIDHDGDGRIAEDGPGGVNLDRNFPHEWPEYARDAGPYPLSEPATYALGRFVIERPDVFAVIAYGRHDNLAGAKEAVKALDEADRAYHTALAQIFTDTTGQTSVPPATDAAGALHTWTYAQRGLPTFATAVWTRPDGQAGVDATADAADDAQDSPPQGPLGRWTGTVNVPDMGPMDFTLTLNDAGGDATEGTLATNVVTLPVEGEVKGDTATLTAAMGPQTLTIVLTATGDELRGTSTDSAGQSIDIIATRAAADDGGAGAKSSALGNDAMWLDLADERGIGFVDWTPFDHPTLGPVEIGGFVPGFRMNPPAEALDDLAAEHAAFAVAVAERRPRLSVLGPTVERLADGLYDVRLGLVNDGELPTTTARARTTRAVMPMIVRLSTPVERIISGRRIERVWGVEPHGGRATLHWIIRAEDGEDVTIAVEQPHLGERTVKVSPGQ